MNKSSHNKLVSFIWSIADDCLRDVYVRGKYRDVILPMIVLRRLDALLEPTKDAVLEELAFQRDEAGFTEWDETGLREASGYVFYNTSKWTLQKIKDTATNSSQILQGNFEDYLNGFSPNVKEIIGKFKLRSQVAHMASKDVLLDVLEKFTSSHINLTPFEKLDPDGRKLPALSNLGMGYVFEELIRKFNEENNEEAGEHFTPREVIDLMTHIIFDPIKDNLPSVMTIYDPACGSGGMLTESQNFIKDEDGAIKAMGDVYLFGKEINDETYAICKSDMMIKGNNPENIRVGSTLSTDEFAGRTFDFMLSNPPYGKSWSSEQKYIKDGKDVIDSRFQIKLNNYWDVEEEADAIPRSSDGQLLFLMEMVSKMKPLDQSPKGTRIASVHNGSSLFTGDAGGGESNIRRYIIENDWLEAIVQLPNNLFYNTGITTYIWILSNNKPDNRKGKVQLIDAGQLYRKLRKNLGNKNCEFSPKHITKIVNTYTEMSVAEREGEQGISAQVFDNEDFGYYKAIIERPKRLKIQFTDERVETLRYDSRLQEPMQYAYETWGDAVYKDITKYKEELLDWCEKQDLNLSSGNKKKLTSQKTWDKHAHLIKHAKFLMNQFFFNLVYDDYNLFTEDLKEHVKPIKDLGAADIKAIVNAVSWYDAEAAKVIKKKVKFTAEKLAQLLKHLDCEEKDLEDFGYYTSHETYHTNHILLKEYGQVDGSEKSTAQWREKMNLKKGEYITYETESDLRDTENIPLKDNINSYFKHEVQPHVPEAWINLDATKIGYEISFNKYFYKHTPLRNIEDVTKDILDLEKQSDGLIADILNLV
ncbi:type I restriction-modification system subunit M [Croceibacter atlanticus]|uniref:type I restriction-modification system subunit M n=1 Tax=Croceibacter atlanticus TaxID=313588 RepID=UPI001C606F2C|nr:class I SAM-dependent DNA methyltransferase [Croceibacter atlanticus]MBW4968852.1 type I restriction-modification system subunit M [Croceibacter atlanticus]